MLIRVIILGHSILKRRTKFLDINWLHREGSSAWWWLSVICVWIYIVVLWTSLWLRSSLWDAVYTAGGYFSLENLQQTKLSHILATLEKGGKLQQALEASEFPLAAPCPKPESLSPGDWHCENSSPQGKPVNVSRWKGGMLHYENGLGLAEFSLFLWNRFLYL